MCPVVPIGCLKATSSVHSGDIEHPARIEDTGHDSHAECATITETASSSIPVRAPDGPLALTTETEIAGPGEDGKRDSDRPKREPFVRVHLEMSENPSETMSPSTETTQHQPQTAEEAISGIQLAETLAPEQKALMKDMLLSFHEAFGFANIRPARLPKTHVKLKEGYTGVRHMPRVYPALKRAALRRWIQAMVNAGIYKRLESNPWATRVIMIKKPDGSWRVCGDYVDVNEQCVTDAGPMPDHRSKMSTFRGCRFFAVFDMENGYLQGETDEAGTSIFAFTTEDGVYGPLRVPYGAKNAPRWFHNAVAEIVRGLEGTESVFDDVAIGAPSFELLVMRVAAFLRRIVDYNIKLKSKKAVIGGKTLRWVGRIIDGDTIQIDKSRLGGLLGAIAPYDRATLRSFLAV